MTKAGWIIIVRHLSPRICFAVHKLSWCLLGIVYIMPLGRMPQGHAVMFAFPWDRLHKWHPTNRTVVWQLRCGKASKNSVLFMQSSSVSKGIIFRYTPISYGLTNEIIKVMQIHPAKEFRRNGKASLVVSIYITATGYKASIRAVVGHRHVNGGILMPPTLVLGISEYYDKDYHR